MYKPYTKLKVVRCKDFPGLIGKVGVVSFYQDDPTKIKISFDQNWQGYFRPTQVEKFEEIIK